MGDGGLFSAAKWAPTADGSYTSNFTPGSIANFAVVNGTGTSSSITVGGIVATENFTLTTASGTISNRNNGVVNINVASGKTLDFSGVGFATSGTAGYVKDGAGVLALAGGAYGGGFTLNSGTVIARGMNAMGGSITNTLTINGGVIASNASRDFTGKYGGGIAVGGNFQLGDTTGLANSTASMTFSNSMNLGSANRTITLGNGGTMTLGGVISNAGSGGITFAATAGGVGQIAITNAANTFTGPISITGGEVRFTADGSLGNVNNEVDINGGRFATLSGATYTLSATRAVRLGSAAGTSISTPGAGTLTYNGVLSDLTSNGILVKQGDGTLALGGVSTYTGSTSVDNGVLRLTTGNDRLPTGTTVSVGQAASANLGTLDLNGFSQTVAGLISTTGTNASATLKNTVTSASAATLTLGGSGTYSYGDGSAANSGVITGTVAVVKSGTGTQTFGDTNTYTDGTTVTRGTLVLGHATNTLSDTGSVTVNGGTLTLGTNSDTVGAVTLTSGAITGTGTLTGASYAVQAGNASAVLGGTGGLTKTTAGVVTLTGANTYTGATSVSGGTLLLSNSAGSATGAGAVTVDGAAVLAGTGSAAGTVTVTSGAVAPGAGGIGALAVGGDLTFAGAGTRLRVAGGPWNTSTKVNVTGNVTFGGGTALDIDLGGATAGHASGSYTYTVATAAAFNGTPAVTFSGLSGGHSVNSFTYFTTGGRAQVAFHVTPEPATVLGLAAAGVGLAGWVRRRRAASGAA